MKYCENGQIRNDRNMFNFCFVVKIKENNKTNC